MEIMQWQPHKYKKLIQVIFIQLILKINMDNMHIILNNKILIFFRKLERTNKP